MITSLSGMNETDTCDLYPLLPTPGDIVSITNDKRQAAILCDQAGHIFVPFPLILRP